MAYFPVLRGKQFELVCLRENAERIADWGMSPLLEPVKDSLSALVRALNVLQEAGASAWVVANPMVGAHKNRYLVTEENDLSQLVSNSRNINWVYQIGEEADLEYVSKFLIDAPRSALFHHGNVSALAVVGALADANLAGVLPVMNFFREKCGDRYRLKFDASPSIGIEDGFKKQIKNSHYPDDEVFSDLLLVYKAKGFYGFGDYLVVGEEFSEGGGPAFAVAIHITYRNQKDDGAIHIKHFVSDTNETSDNPAGKFREALSKLAGAVAAPGSMISRTSAIEEFLALHRSEHFPGLGYVKKLSIQHHLELMGE